MALNINIIIIYTGNLKIEFLIRFLFGSFWSLIFTLRSRLNRLYSCRPVAVWRLLSVNEKKEAALSSSFKDGDGMMTQEHWGKRGLIVSTTKFEWRLIVLTGAAITICRAPIVM